MNDTCIDDVMSDNDDDELPKVVIEIEPMNPSELSISEVTNTISHISNVSPSDLVIGAVIDENGLIVSFIVYVDDENTAKAIEESVSSLRKGDECEEGILCRSKSARIESRHLSKNATEL